MPARHGKNKGPGDLRSSATLERLARRLFANAEQRERFKDAVAAGKSASSALIWLTDRPSPLPFAPRDPSPWQPDFVDVVSYRARPGSHPLHEEGAYYCLDESSVFEASAVRAIEHPAPTVLDLCASPGGKTVFAHRALDPAALISNEVIGKRTAALISNIERCRIPASVTRADVSLLAEALPGSFDLVIVDAPCSGQSLVARGSAAPGCFHPATINQNSNRQKRILATAAALVPAGGYLAYMTCTYSFEENEGVIEWFLKKLPGFRSVPVPALEPQRSTLTAQHAYRLFPFEGFGAGGFTALLRQEGSAPRSTLSLDRVRTVYEPRRASDEPH